VEERKIAQAEGNEAGEKEKRGDQTEQNYEDRKE
jgi:hypothetical protein